MAPLEYDARCRCRWGTAFRTGAFTELSFMIVSALNISCALAFFFFKVLISLMCREERVNYCRRSNISHTCSYIHVCIYIYIYLLFTDETSWSRIGVWGEEKGGTCDFTFVFTSSSVHFVFTSISFRFHFALTSLSLWLNFDDTFISLRCYFEITPT